MGVYPVACKKCGHAFNWFSGNPNNQLCEKCINAKMEPNMSHQPQNHLESIISLQAEVIALLKSEIERLKTENLYKVKVIEGGGHTIPQPQFSPYQQQPPYPVVPGFIDPYTPQVNPFGPTYIVTSGDPVVGQGSETSSTSFTLHNGTTSMTLEDALRSYKT